MGLLYMKLVIKIRIKVDVVHIYIYIYIFIKQQNLAVLVWGGVAPGS